MVKSSRRKKKDRAKAEARRAEQARRRARAEHDRQWSEHFRQIHDPGTEPEEVARLILAEMSDSLIVGAAARLRLVAGVPAGQLTEITRLLLASTPEPPGLGVLAFAASAAHAAGDEDGEHRYTAELLARAEAEDSEDDALRLEVIRSIAAIGHPGEATELIEPYLRDHPDDEHAAEIYAAAVELAYEQAEPGELERAALDRFADRSGLDALRDAIGGYLDRTKWGDIVAKRVEENTAMVTDMDWSAADQEAFAAIAFGVAVNGTADGEDDRDLDEQETALTAFATDPSVSPALASRALAWAKHEHYGVWQLADPAPNPGVWCTDLVAGTRRYVEFPAAALDGAPPWTAWLGAVGPVDGIWRGSGAGVRLSPSEGDAVTEYIEQTAIVMSQVILGQPHDEIPEPEEIRFGHAEPYGARWEYEEPTGGTFAPLASMVTAVLIPQLAAQVAKHRAEPRLPNNPARHFAWGSGRPPAAPGAAPAAEGWENWWLDEQVPALGDRTPRQAAAGDVSDLTRLESLLRLFEYQAGQAAAQGEKGIDVPWLRAQLNMPGQDMD